MGNGQYRRDTLTFVIGAPEYNNANLGRVHWRYQLLTPGRVDRFALGIEAKQGQTRWTFQLRRNGEDILSEPVDLASLPQDPTGRCGLIAEGRVNPRRARCQGGDELTLVFLEQQPTNLSGGADLSVMLELSHEVW